MNYRSIVLYCLVGLLFAPLASVGQMDNLANMSAKWVRSNVRNAATDAADIVNYNPAGLTSMNNGIHLSLSNQTLFRKPQHSFNLGAGEQSYEQDGIDPILPMFYAAYKVNKLAFYSGVYISGGGASANYPDGSISTNLLGYQIMAQANAAIPGDAADYKMVANQHLKASSYYLTVPIGVAYAINEKLSVSVGARYLKGINKTEAGMELAGSAALPNSPFSVSYNAYANGFGGVFGVNYKATDRLNLSAHFETKVKMEFETEDFEGNVPIGANGEKKRRDLPAVLNTGLMYKITDKFSVGADYNYYFQTYADWGKITDPRDGNVYEASDVAGDCYTANLGFYYQLSPKLELSTGCSYTAFEYDDKELYYTTLGPYEALKNNNFNVGIGAGYKVTEKIQVDLAFARTFWKDYTINAISAANPLMPNGLPVKTTDKGYVIAVGFDFSF